MVFNGGESVEIEQLTIPMVNKNFYYFKVIYRKTDLTKIVEKAYQVLRNLNPNDPSGKEREKKQREIKNLGGLISEKLVNDLLNEYCFSSIKCPFLLK